MRILLAFACYCLAFTAGAQDYYLFVGTYTSGDSKGIYVYRFNNATGTAQWVSNTDSCSNPSFLSLAPNGQYVYAVNETGGKQPGRVSAYRFDAQTGRLHFMNTQASGGDHPCFVTTDQTGKWVIAGNYTGGNLSALKVNPDGSLAPAAQIIQHEGSSANKQRQNKAHVHSTFFAPDFKQLLVPDLGMDKVMLYDFNPGNPQPLSTSKQAYVAAAPGSGPRHLVFHPNKQFVYVLEELSGTIKSYTYRNGKLEDLQVIATHPDDFKGQPGSADIHISPDGKFLYASNRGEENNLAIFTIDPGTGKLKANGYQAIPGKGPRNFIIDPSGKHLLVANQYTNNIVIYAVNTATGALTEQSQIAVPNPVCLKLLPIQVSH
ncbi:MAG: lactonase family protein [Chitinophagaceae bacterium]|jgi:6-phosphogluconolactonase|nr:lactonase family protein [Chitinophagaceae bacterium]